MLKGLRAAAHVFNQKIGLSRLGLVLSFALVVIAAVVLYRILREIDLEEVVDALEATDWRTLATAGLFVAAGYLTLTFYDLFALAHDRPLAKCRIASPRSRVSRAMPSDTMSAPASFPAARCAIAFIPPGA